MKVPYRCPSCESADDLMFQCMVVLPIDQDPKTGNVETDLYRYGTDTLWEDDYEASCRACGWDGEIKDCKRKNQTKKAGAA